MSNSRPKFEYLKDNEWVSMKALDMKITMKDIRVWYEENYGKLEAGDIAEGYDICDILWFYEKSRNLIGK